ncbi:unnamed protein product [Citrullus colocynthis]|uniref:Uncharacterized protein n=1 Tax=Citrullus colocynthis TaxID=252529 RepID=A0ABP0YLU1_9ROSI
MAKDQNENSKEKLQPVVLSACHRSFRRVKFPGGTGHPVGVPNCTLNCQLMSSGTHRPRCYATLRSLTCSRAYVVFSNTSRTLRKALPKQKVYIAPGIREESAGKRWRNWTFSYVSKNELTKVGGNGPLRLGCFNHHKHSRGILSPGR